MHAGANSHVVIDSVPRAITTLGMNEHIEP
jgi:hypothetical protein